MFVAMHPGFEGGGTRVSECVGLTYRSPEVIPDLRDKMSSYYIITLRPIHASVVIGGKYLPVEIHVHYLERD